MSIKYNINYHKPDNFLAHVHVAGCNLQFKDKFLLLLRNSNKPQGDTWGIPAGKIEVNEDPITAIIRETYEEVGLILKKEKIEEIGKLYVSHSNMEYEWHQFYYLFENEPTIFLNTNEHKEAKWITYHEAKKLPLIAGGIEALEIYWRFINERKKNT